MAGWRTAMGCHEVGQEIKGMVVAGSGTRRYWWWLEDGQQLLPYSTQQAGMREERKKGFGC